MSQHPAKGAATLGPAAQRVCFLALPDCNMVAVHEAWLHRCWSWIAAAVGTLEQQLDCLEHNVCASICLGSQPDARPCLRVTIQSAASRCCALLLRQTAGHRTKAGH